MTHPDRPVQIAVCERHGLKYNAADESGCVRCRRDSAAAAIAAPAGARTASAPLQLLLAVLLVAGTGALFCAAQRTMVDGYAILRWAAGRGDMTVAGTRPDGFAGGDGHSTAGRTGAPQPGSTPDAALDPQQQMQRMERQLLQQMQRQRATAGGSAPNADDQQ